MHIRLLLVALFAVASSIASAATPTEATIEGWHWKFPIPAGYCALDPTKPLHKRVIDAETAMLPPGGILGAVALDCAGFDSLQKGAWAPTKELVYMVAKEDSTTSFVRGLSRLEYIHAMVQSIPVAGTANLAKDATKSLKDRTGVEVAVPRFSLMGQDEYAFYAASLANVTPQSGGAVVSIASVSAGTKIGMHLFTIRVTQKYDADRVYAPMLEETKAAAREFLHANPW